VAVAEMTVEDVEGKRIAVGRGAYKTGGGNADGPWSDDTRGALED
jgi:hypothetical protein